MSNPLYQSFESGHIAFFKKPVEKDWAFKLWLVIAAVFLVLSLFENPEIFSDPAYFFSGLILNAISGLIVAWMLSVIWLLPRFVYQRIRSNQGYFQNGSASLSPRKTPKSFPVNLVDGNQIYIDENLNIDEKFIFQNFTLFDEKLLEHNVFDWHPDLLTRMSEQMYMQDYIEMAKGISPVYYEIAPVRISNDYLNLKDTVGVGVLSEEALCFFWETRKRMNIAVIFNFAIRKITQIEDFKFKSTCAEAICRRSPSPETVPVSDWTFSPVLSSYAPKNTDSLKLYFSLMLLQDKYLDSGFE